MQNNFDLTALQHALKIQGETCYQLINERCPHLFATTSAALTTAQFSQMKSVIAAVERIVNLPNWLPAAVPAKTAGVFYGYDFHLNATGAHLIEINSNAGGGFLNAVLSDSQQLDAKPASKISHELLAMFQNEWHLARGNAPLKTIAIVDEQPESQYLYPEFLLAQKLFADAGIQTCIVDPSAFVLRTDGLYLGEVKIDLVYNRLTDFSLQNFPLLQQADVDDRVVLTPNPRHYLRYADKVNLVRLSDEKYLRELGADAADVLTLQAGLPQTILVKAELENELWRERKNWFFKPVSGYGSKGAYRGDKLTTRVFQEILQADYVAQRLAQPGEVELKTDENGTPHSLKFDLRCYVYQGNIQLMAARLYQGQTTNFRTVGGGFAWVIQPS